jgi:hypothetical protein
MLLQVSYGCLLKDSFKIHRVLGEKVYRTCRAESVFVMVGGTGIRNQACSIVYNTEQLECALLLTPKRAHGQTLIGKR